MSEREVANKRILSFLLRCRGGAGPRLQACLAVCPRLSLYYDLLCPLALLVLDVLVDAFRLALRIGMFVGLDKVGNFSVFSVSVPAVSVEVR